MICLSVSGSFPETLSANNHFFGEPITEIRIFGNHKTRSDVVISWANLEIGQPLSQDILELARQNIIDTGLFKQVSLEAESADSRVNSHYPSGGKVLYLIVTAPEP